MLQIDVQQIAEPAIVRAPGNPNRSASLEALAITGVGVAEARGELGGRLIPQLRRGRPQISSSTGTARLVGKLRQKGRMTRAESIENSSRA